MSKWSLPNLLSDIHRDVEMKLSIARNSLAHPGTKGDGSENIWLAILRTYLPKRYEVSKAHVVDSRGDFSGQIDIVVYDRQYSPFVFVYEEQLCVPAESVYAIFEIKQSVDAGVVEYAQDKIQSVRKLHRTTLPIPHAGGWYDPKPLIPILGGILSLESEWNPAMGKSLHNVLAASKNDGLINIGCIANHGYFNFDKEKNDFEFLFSHKASTAFLLKLISVLQYSGTVPMIDVDAYAKWL
tara:strand:+ start:11976 stop:12695 length:720 start_codon:yes stop_codon:yes gene_type:complete